jgi:hypothetical protein
MEKWRTAQDLTAAHDRLAATLPDWRAPYAHGVGLIPADAGTASADHFPVVNVGTKSLPGVVMAEVTGYRSGTVSLPLGRDQLERAIRLLTPAEACTEHPHPNLWTWRDHYLPALTADPKARLVAVFVATAEAGIDEVVEVAAFREALQIHHRQRAGSE